MSEPDAKDEKRVDESWKAQVEAEKRQASASPPADDPPLPLPTFLLHVTGLVAQAQVALGLAPDPLQGRRQFRPNLARHLIDTLAMLQEKTRGNLRPEEDQHLQQALHQLRLAFLQQQQSASAPTAPKANRKDDKTDNPPKILTP